MTQAIELHGKVECPFAWRTRLSAFEKGVRFEYIAFDAPASDPRSARNNPERRSPLLVHGDFRLTESGVIAQYIDEAFDGRALVPRDARERARLRVDLVELGKLEADPHLAGVLSAEDRQQVTQGYQLLELRVRVGMAVPDGLERVNAYLERVVGRESYLATRPPWAR
jgi:glutathione S-transferase